MGYISQVGWTKATLLVSNLFRMLCRNVIQTGSVLNELLCDVDASSNGSDRSCCPKSVTNTSAAAATTTDVRCVTFQTKVLSTAKITRLAHG